MKSAVSPQVRDEPELRAELGDVSHEGETLPSFHEHGQAAWEHYRATGVSSTADEVLDKLQRKLDAKRRQLGG